MQIDTCRVGIYLCREGIDLCRVGIGSLTEAGIHSRYTYRVYIDISRVYIDVCRVNMTVSHYAHAGRRMRSRHGR